MIRDSSVGIATSYVFDGRDSITGRGKIFFYIVHTVLTHPVSYLTSTVDDILWVKWAREQI
jgi:hypothetical protein